MWTSECWYGSNTSIQEQVIYCKATAKLALTAMEMKPRRENMTASVAGKEMMSFLSLLRDHFFPETRSKLAPKNQRNPQA